MIRHRIPHPFAPPHPGGTPTEELIDRHAHLVAVGLANCRAAQALKKEITRRQLEQHNAQLENKPALLPNDDNHYNPLEQRDKKTGKWITGGDLLPDDLKRLLAYAEQHFFAPAGKALDRAGKVAMAKLGDLGDQLTGEDKLAESEDNPDAYAMASRLADQDPAIQKLLAETAQELKDAKTEAQWQEANRKHQEAIHARDVERMEIYKRLKVSPSNMEALSRGDAQLPVESNLNLLPAPVRVFTQASQGLIESSPRLAVMSGLEAVGMPPEVAAAAAFGITAQGLDPKQALLAAAVPIVGEYAEDITQSIAATIGISNEFAQQLFKKMGGAAGMTALIGADQLKEIWKQAPEKQKAMLIRVAAILGAIFLMGMVGHGEPTESGSPGGDQPEVGTTSRRLTTPIGELRAAGQKDAHHVIQDAAVRDVPGYDTQAAPGVPLPGPSTARGTPHYGATQSQRQPGGGNYEAERQIGYEALREGGYSDAEARQIISEADEYFNGIGVSNSTPTRIPGNRK